MTEERHELEILNRGETPDKSRLPFIPSAPSLDLDKYREMARDLAIQQEEADEYLRVLASILEMFVHASWDWQALGNYGLLPTSRTSFWC